jgi:hypothetical protein
MLPEYFMYFCPQVKPDRFESRSFNPAREILKRSSSLTKNDKELSQKMFAGKLHELTQII